MELIVGGLAAVVIMLIAIYGASLREIRGLKNRMVSILLFEDVYASQRSSLLEFVRGTKAKNATDLYHKTAQAAADLAIKRSNNTADTAMALWAAKVKTSEQVPETSVTASGLHLNSPSGFRDGLKKAGLPEE